MVSLRWRRPRERLRPSRGRALRARARDGTYLHASAQTNISAAVAEATAKHNLHRIAPQAKREEPPTGNGQVRKNKTPEDQVATPLRPKFHLKPQTPDCEGCKTLCINNGVADSLQRSCLAS